MTYEPETDDFADEEERTECAADLLAWDRAESLFEGGGQWAQASAHDQNRVWREARRLYRRALRHGIRDRHAITSHVTNELARNERYRSILLLIGLTILGELIKFLIKRWLENRTGADDANA